MRSRLKTLQRLEAVYKVIEHAHGISLDRAKASLQEAEARVERQRDAAQRLSTSGSEALRRGDLAEWLLDQSQIEFTEWNAEVLLQVRDRRAEAMRGAAEIYQASRMQLEQMKSVLAEVRSGVEVEHQRVEQRASDDRFLSRQRWEELEGQRRRVSGPIKPTQCQAEHPEASAAAQDGTTTASVDLGVDSGNDPMNGS